jgi:hypothetical protein
LAILRTSRNGLGDRWHIADSTEKIRQNLPAVAYRGKPLGPTVGKSRMSQRDMPTVGQTIARSATVGKLEAELWQNPPDLWMLYCTDRSFATGDF